MSESVLAMFASWSFIVTGLMFRSLIHFEFIFVYGVRKCSAAAAKLLPCPNYYKQCCDEHWGTCVSLNSGFLGVYAQQWDFWVIWQFYFQLFKETPCCSP